MKPVCSDPPAGIPVAVATSLRDFAAEMLAKPIGTEPSTNRPRLPRYFDSEAHQARPAASAASRLASAVLAAQAEVNQLLDPEPVHPEMVVAAADAGEEYRVAGQHIHSATWWARSTPCRLV